MAESLTFTTISTARSARNACADNKGDNLIPLVLIHGWGLNSGVWQPLIDKFISDENALISQNLELITVDLPGFGKNSHVEYHALFIN